MDKAGEQVECRVLDDGQSPGLATAEGRTGAGARASVRGAP